MNLTYINTTENLNEYRSQTRHESGTHNLYVCIQSPCLIARLFRFTVARRLVAKFRIVMTSQLNYVLKFDAIGEVQSFGKIDIMHRD